MSTPPLPAFRPVPRTGVIYVMTEAAKKGYDPKSPDWSNLGQGMPEAGPLPGGPPRVASIPILLEPERGYAFPASDLRREILGRDLDCALILDEFYSHYVWTSWTASRRTGATPAGA